VLTLSTSFNAVISRDAATLNADARCGPTFSAAIATLGNHFVTYVGQEKQGSLGCDRSKRSRRSASRDR